MKLKDLEKAKGSWFVYDDDEQKFSAIKIQSAIIRKGALDKYINIHGLYLCIREDYFGSDVNDYVFYDYGYHLMKGYILSQKEFEKLYKEKLSDRILKVLSK